MENQHRKITGYRDLSQAEIDLINKIKALGPIIEAVQQEVVSNIAEQYNATSDEDEQQRLKNATPDRFAALARTDFQTALMYLTRAVTQPTFF